jgi:hypothetical protein
MKIVDPVFMVRIITAADDPEQMCHIKKAVNIIPP